MGERFWIGLLERAKCSIAFAHDFMAFGLMYSGITGWERQTDLVLQQVGEALLEILRATMMMLESEVEMCIHVESQCNSSGHNAKGRELRIR